MWFSGVSWFLGPTLPKDYFLCVFLGSCLTREHLSVSVGEIWVGTL